MVPGHVIERDGPIQRHGYMMDRRCAEIHRVRTGSLDVAPRASISADDQAIRLQMLLIDIATSTYDPPMSPPPRRLIILSRIRRPITIAPTSGARSGNSST